MSHACTGKGSNVSCWGCHSGTVVTVARTSRSICGSVERATGSNLLLRVPQFAGTEHHSKSDCGLLGT